MASVKGYKGSKQGPIAQRLATLLDVFSPWEDISLTYRQFAAEIGKPLTEAAVKKWPRRRKFPADAARLIARRARDRGLAGVTLEWILWGEGPGPQKTPKHTPAPTMERPLPPADHADLDRGTSPRAPHGLYAARIAQALEADLGHNEFGQWSSVEVQRTVIWALKDLARRLRVLQFDMGKSFELTDEWAAEIGLPVRPKPSQTETS